MKKHSVKSVASVAAAAIMCVPALAMAGCGGGSAEPGIYVPGTYTGEAEGHGGPVTVTLTVDGNSIVKVDEVVGDDETSTRGGKFISDGTFAAQIEAAQSADIDGVSGATETSEAIEEAVAEALEQAMNTASEEKAE